MYIKILYLYPNTISGEVNDALRVLFFYKHNGNLTSNYHSLKWQRRDGEKLGMSTIFKHYRKKGRKAQKETSWTQLNFACLRPTIRVRSPLVTREKEYVWVLLSVWEAWSHDIHWTLHDHCALGQNKDIIMTIKFYLLSIVNNIFRYM